MKLAWNVWHTSTYDRVSTEYVLRTAPPPSADEFLPALLMVSRSTLENGRLPTRLKMTLFSIYWPIAQAGKEDLHRFTTHTRGGMLRSIDHDAQAAATT